MDETLWSTLGTSYVWWSGRTWYFFAHEIVFLFFFFFLSCRVLALLPRIVPLRRRRRVDGCRVQWRFETYTAHGATNVILTIILLYSLLLLSFYSVRIVNVAICQTIRLRSVISVRLFIYFHPFGRRRVRVLPASPASSAKLFYLFIFVSRIILLLLLLSPSSSSSPCAWYANWFIRMFEQDTTYAPARIPTQSYTKNHPRPSPYHYERTRAPARRSDPTLCTLKVQITRNNVCRNIILFIHLFTRVFVCTKHV